MSFTLYHNPGQIVTVVFETLNAAGIRSDGYSFIPSVTRVIFPNLSLAMGYPQNMTRLDVGLFNFKFTLPGQASSVGSYIVDINYQNPDTGQPKQTFVQVVVTAPFGQYTATTF